MTRLLCILSLTVLFCSCSNEEPIEGTWYASYWISGDRQVAVEQTMLLDFSGSEIRSVRIRNVASGKMNEIQIDTSEFQISDGRLEYDTLSLPIEIEKDSLTIEFDNLKLVWRRIPEDYRNLNLDLHCFSGSYFLNSLLTKDSISFINDSLLLFTGEYNLNYPGKKWSIVEYDGFQLLNIHFEFHPVYVIKSCSTSSIILEYPSIERFEIVLEPTSIEADKEKLIGQWTQIMDSVSYPLPAPPIGSTAEDLNGFIDIRSDSITFSHLAKVETFDWDLTSDGKRTYSLSHFFEKGKSWKILALTDSTLAISMGSGLQNRREEILWFERVGNPR